MLVQVVDELDHALRVVPADADGVEGRQVDDQLAQADAAGVRADHDAEARAASSRIATTSLTLATRQASIWQNESALRLEELLEHDAVVDVLAGGHADGRHGPGDGGVAEDVVRAGGLLDPERTELGQPAIQAIASGTLQTWLASTIR